MGVLNIATGNTAWLVKLLFCLFFYLFV